MSSSRPDLSESKHIALGLLFALNCWAGLTLGLGAEAKRGAARFEPEIRAFEAADRTNPPPVGAVLFVGSSSIRLWPDLKKDFPGWPVIQRGFGGSEISDVITFTERIVLPYKPRLILLYAGDNDLASGKSPAQVQRDFASFVAKVRKTLPKTRIGYIAIKPSIQRWHLLEKVREANNSVRGFAQGETDIDYIDIFTPMLPRGEELRKDLFVEDGLHLSRKGYDLWADAIRKYLSKHAPQGRD
jgi:lysophospholipase L1-like esterase